MAGVKRCSAQCTMFRCGKNALMYRGNTVWCRWTEEECQVANCNYTTCVKRRLLPNGICGETVKRRTVELEPEKAMIPPVRLRGKIRRKLGDEEIF